MTVPPWEKAMVQATFRGVPFEVESLDEAGGHNLASHNWIDSDDVATENTGRKEDGYSVEGYLWGDDCLDAKKKLREAFKKRGPGEYQDRWGEKHWVNVESWAFRLVRQDGGWIVVRVEFKEAGTKAQPTTTLDTAAVVDERADDSLSAVAGSFESGFDTAGPSYLGEDAVALLTDMGGTMSDLSATLASGGRPLGEFQRGLSSLLSGATSLVGVPGVLAGRVQGLISTLLSLSGSSRRRYSAAQSLTSVGSNWSTVSATTATRASQSANRDALSALVRQTALVEAARSSASVDFTTYDEAIATRNTLTGALSSEIRATGSDSLKSTLRLLNAAVIRDINTRGADLTKLSDITPATTLPALVVAHQLLGDATRASEILSRNPSIKDPLAVPGGRALKVLADG